MGIILTPPKSTSQSALNIIEIWFQVTIWAFIMAISWWLGAGSVAKWWFGCFSCTFLHCINSMWNWESHPKWSLPNVFARWWFSGYIKFQSWSEVFNSVVVGCWSLKINKKACQIVTLASVQFNKRCKYWFQLSNALQQGNWATKGFVIWPVTVESPGTTWIERLLIF